MCPDLMTSCSGSKRSSVEAYYYLCKPLDLSELKRILLHAVETTSRKSSEAPSGSSGKDYGCQSRLQEGIVPRIGTHHTAKAFPIFSPTGYTGAGHCGSLPIYRRENTYQVVGNISSSYSAHTTKTGVDIRRRQLTEFQTNRENGRFNFASTQTNNPSRPGVRI